MAAPLNGNARLDLLDAFVGMPGKRECPAVNRHRPYTLLRDAVLVADLDALCRVLERLVCFAPKLVKNSAKKHRKSEAPRVGAFRPKLQRDVARFQRGIGQSDQPE